MLFSRIGDTGWAEKNLETPSVRFYHGAPFRTNLHQGLTSNAISRFVIYKPRV
jgi:hypothetical protein